MASSPRRPTRVALGLAVLLVVAGAFALWLRSSSLVAVQHVSVSGVSGGQAAEITRALTAEAQGMTTLHVREDALRRSVSAYPVVRSLRTETDFPHRLRITVNAYEPVAALRSTGGAMTAVAADGTILRGATTRGLAVVGVRTPPGAERLGAGPARESVLVLGAAPRALRERVARVYRGPRGLTATMRSGPKLLFGRGDRLDAKWDAAAQVLAHATSRGASYIDVRVPERPVAGGLQPRAPEPQARL